MLTWPCELSACPLQWKLCCTLRNGTSSLREMLWCAFESADIVGNSAMEWRILLKNLNLSTCITITKTWNKVKKQEYFQRVPLGNEDSYSVRLDPDECGHAPWVCGFDWMELRKSDSHSCHFRPSALWCGMPMQNCLRNVYHTACTPKVSSRLIHVLPCVSEKENKLHWDNVTRRLDESNYHKSVITGKGFIAPLALVGLWHRRRRVYFNVVVLHVGWNV